MTLETETKTVKEYKEDFPITLPTEAYFEKFNDNRLLALEFIRLLGMKDEEQVTIVNFWPDNTLERTEKLAKVTSGWVWWQGEESDVVFKNGKRTGSLASSARGGSYWADMYVGNKHYISHDGMNGQWKEAVK
jgi:hypothetical protein